MGEHLPWLLSVRGEAEWRGEDAGLGFLGEHRRPLGPQGRESPGSPAPRLSMLRIKSENGEQAFLLMMRPRRQGRRCARPARTGQVGVGHGWRPEWGSSATTQPDLCFPVPRAVESTTFEIFNAFRHSLQRRRAHTAGRGSGAQCHAASGSPGLATCPRPQINRPPA